MNRIELCGRDHNLRFSVNALCMLEEEMGCGLEEIMRKPLSGIRGLLWCGLKEEEPSITLADAGKMLEKHLETGGSLESVSNTIAESLEEAGFFPRPGREQKKAGKA